jgi:hypothetical protein
MVLCQKVSWDPDTSVKMAAYGAQRSGNAKGEGQGPVPVLGLIPVCLSQGPCLWASVSPAVKWQLVEWLLRTLLVGTRAASFLSLEV